ncbi:hypothetical protein ACFXTH_022133 [Malus domestica]
MMGWGICRERSKEAKKMEKMWTDGANALELGSLLGLGVAQRRGCLDDVLHHHRLHHEDLSVKSFEQTPQDCKSME